MKSTMQTPDRRLFLMQSGVVLGGLAVMGTWPVSLLGATPSACLVDASLYPDPCGDWTVDHVCSHWPPYAFDTGAGRPHTTPQAGAGVGADWHWAS